jgi:hypothetical protein
MNPALQQLKDIHLPPSISMWPTTPGWILLTIASSVLILTFIYYGYQKRKQRQVVKYTLLQLQQLKLLMQHNPQNINIAAEISTLIRRTALYYFKRDAIAGLSGQHWLTFLNDSGHTSEFTTEAGLLLIDAPYRKHNHSDLTALFTLTENWLATIARIKKKEK